MKKARIRWRAPGVFSCLYWGFCPNEREWRRLRADMLRKHHTDLGLYPHESDGYTSYIREEPIVVVAISSRLDDRPDRLASTIAHEALHVVHHILRRVAETEPGEETMAHLLTNIVERMTRDHRRAVEKGIRILG